MQEVIIPDIALFLHQVAGVGLIGLLTAEELLLAHAQVSLWSEVKAGTGAVAIPKAQKALPLHCQLRVCFEVEITGEGVQSHLLYLVNIDTWAEACSWPRSYACYGHQEVVALDIDNS